MATVLLVIHLMIAATLVGVVLLQKSEGGALGIGGGGGGGNGDNVEDKVVDFHSLSWQGNLSLEGLIRILST